jgi:hypothetical protein
MLILPAGLQAMVDNGTAWLLPIPCPDSVLLPCGHPRDRGTLTIPAGAFPGADAAAIAACIWNDLATVPVCPKCRWPVPRVEIVF